MRRAARRFLCALLIVPVLGCAQGWRRSAGTVSLVGTRPVLHQQEGARGAAKRVFFTVPEGWRWCRRPDGILLTREGPFLQQIFVERFTFDRPPVDFAWYLPPAAALDSARQWPLRTAKYLEQPLTQGMSPVELAGKIAEGRRNNPGVEAFELREVAAAEVAGRQGFRGEVSFRLDPTGFDEPLLYAHDWPSFAVQGRKTPYREEYVGFELDGWIYLFSYTAARRHYFDRDAGTFQAFLTSLRLDTR